VYGALLTIVLAPLLASAAAGFFGRGDSGEGEAEGGGPLPLRES
jgi:hypothetical protein